MPLKDFAFRPLFPQERCEEALWVWSPTFTNSLVQNLCLLFSFVGAVQAEVDRIGWATAICYGLLIPCFLGFLFAKQNVVMRKVKTAVMHTTCDDEKGRVWLQGLESKQSFKDRRCAKIADVCSFPPEKGLPGKPQATRCYEYISMTLQENTATPV